MSVVNKIQAVSSFIEELRTSRHVEETPIQGNQEFEIRVERGSLQATEDRKNLRFRVILHLTPKSGKIFVKEFYCKLVFALMLIEPATNDELSHFLEDETSFNKAFFPFLSETLASITGRMGISPLQLDPTVFVSQPPSSSSSAASSSSSPSGSVPA